MTYLQSHDSVHSQLSEQFFVLGENLGADGGSSNVG